MKSRFIFIARLALLGLFLSSCSLPGTQAVIPATNTPNGPTSVSSTPADTDTPPVAVIPSSLTPTLASPAIAHFAPGQKIDITFIHMIDLNKGWGIGGLNKASDHVFRTQDGGQTWDDITPPQPAPSASTSITALGYFLNADMAWVAYGPAMVSVGVPPFIQVWKTMDGGGTWSYGSIDTSVVSGEAFSPYYLDFVNPQQGWLMVYLGSGMMHAYVALFRTNDGGATWTDILDPFMENDIQSFPKTGLVFTNGQTGWLTRDAQGVDPTPHIFHTTDGGVTWTRIDLPAPSFAPNLFDSEACGSYSPNTFSSTSVLIVLKCLDNATFKIEKNYVYSTTDGGNYWETYLLPSDYTLGAGLYFFSPQSGLALGRKLYTTSDGGQTWKFIQQVYWDGQFSFLDPNLGWAYVINDQGDIGLVKTINGGSTWTILHPVVKP